jgi:hypothetical protein
MRSRPRPGSARISGAIASRAHSFFFRTVSTTGAPTTPLPNAVQAAQHHARATLDDERIDILGPTSAQFADGVWRIELEYPAANILVTLAETLSEPLLSTCSATRTGRSREYRLLSVQIL